MENRKKIPPEKEGDPFWPTIDRILEHRSREYREEPRPISIHPLERAQFDYTLLDSPSRDVPFINGTGLIDASINPLVGNREGRYYIDGNTLGFETTHQAQLSNYFSLYARPRLELLAPNTGSSQFNVFPQQLYGKTACHNIELEVGRDSLVWGQGKSGGLLLSNNAPPLDMVKISTPSPFYLPWIFKYVGPTSFQLFFADLGPERDYPHAILSGYKITLKPVTFFEIGLNYTIMMGGRGANAPSFWEAIQEFTGVLTAIQKNTAGADKPFTNRLFSLEGRWALPFFRNSIFYAEIGFDDTNREIRTLFEDNAIYYAGVYIPRLNSNGTMDLRLEYKHIPAGAYRHGQYTSGYTLNRRLIGDEGGPDSETVLLEWRWDLQNQLTHRTSLSYQQRDSDLFTGLSSGVELIDFVKAQDNPAEHRWQLNEGVLWAFKPNWRVELEAGYEYISGFNFNPGRNSNNFIGSVSFSFSPAL